MPAQICIKLVSKCSIPANIQGVRLTKLEIMLIGQAELGCLQERLGSEYLLSHLIHGILDARTVVTAEDIQYDAARDFPGRVKLGSRTMHLLQV